MQQLTPDQRRQITNYMRNMKRRARAPEARRYPRAFTETAGYIEAYNKLNAGPYRQRVTLDY